MFKKLHVGMAIVLASFVSCSENKTTVPALQPPSVSPPGQPGSVGVTVTIPQGATTMGAQAFGTNPLVIIKGTTVTWINGDAVSHTATSTSTPSVWDSGALAPGESFSFTFETSGTYTYVCSIHPLMTGVIEVRESVEPSPSPSPDETNYPPDDVNNRRNG
ncbi:MAG: plastocyanin/azurin family copper-binding protein [Bdellovibrionota bacterium]